MGPQVGDLLITDISHPLVRRSVGTRPETFIADIRACRGCCRMVTSYSRLVESPLSYDGRQRASSENSTYRTSSKRAMARLGLMVLAWVMQSTVGYPAR